tara:strand:+ start:77 stop:298 length:222 start_codon:yes stop_codon:yes gene_type:complete
MANKTIPESITFEGLVYKLDDRDKVAAQASLEADFSGLPTSEPATTGSLWISGSNTAPGGINSGYVCVKVKSS